MSSLIYVDLVEDKPLSRNVFDSQYGAAADGVYDAYRAGFQPWHLLVRAGGNNEALFRSTESYFNRADAIHAAEVAFAATKTVILREFGQVDVTIRDGIPHADDVEPADDDDDVGEPVEDDGCRCNSFDGNCPEHGPR